jgi:hypothetical protein
MCVTVYVIVVMPSWNRSGIREENCQSDPRVITTFAQGEALARSAFLE